MTKPPLFAKWRSAELRDATVIEPDGDEQIDVHTLFGLSYSNYAVFPRTLLQSMPVEWQHRFVATVREMEAAFDHVEQADGYRTEAGSWRYINELDKRQLAWAGIQSSDDDPESLVEIEPGLRDFPEGYETTYYDTRTGETLDGGNYTFLPESDPIPPYWCKRTKIEPRLDPEAIPSRHQFPLEIRLMMAFGVIAVIVIEALCILTLTHAI